MLAKGSFVNSSKITKGLKKKVDKVKHAKNEAQLIPALPQLLEQEIKICKIVKIKLLTQDYQSQLLKSSPIPNLKKNASKFDFEDLHLRWNDGNFCQNKAFVATTQPSSVQVT